MVLTEFLVHSTIGIVYTNVTLTLAAHDVVVKWQHPHWYVAITLRWRHNGHDSVSNHQPCDCSVNRLFRRRSKKTSKLRVAGHCVGNSPGTGEFPAQMASNADNVSIWWRHHDITNSSNNEIGTLWSCGKSRVNNLWQWILNSISSNSLFSKEVWIDILRKYNQIGLQITCSTPILHPVTECVLLNCRKIYLARNTNGKLPCVPIHEAAC